ncbi:hypothetical protein D3C76_1694980 [compost metagenome]
MAHQRLQVAVEEALGGVFKALEALTGFEQVRFDPLAVIDDIARNLQPDQQTAGKQQQAQVTSEHGLILSWPDLRRCIRHGATGPTGQARSGARFRSR